MPAPATVPGVYAQALLELAQERGTRSAVVAACRDLADAFTVGSLSALDDPRVGKARAKDAIRGVLSAQPKEVTDLLLLLVDRNRLADAPAILREAVRRAEAADGIVRIKVVAAGQLPAEISQRLTAAVGGKADLVVAVDPSLIGGATVRVGDRLVDGSVKRQLREMHNRMINAPVSDALWAKE